MKKNILILKGGFSNEAEVSRLTAESVAEALTLKGYKTKLIELDKNFLSWLLENKNQVDVIFNALHGAWGEDGKIQSLLEYIKIPYTHSGIVASALGMNKHLSKSIFFSNGIKVPKGKIISKKNLLNKDPFARPFIIKPIDEGSSLGTFLIKEKKIVRNLIKNSKLKKFLAEEYIPGNDITVAIMNGKAIGMIEIITNEDIYDYNAKYKSNKTKYIIPKTINKKTERLLLEVAEMSFKLLQCKGIARADFRYDKASQNNEAYLLEINTQPGLTKTSLFPKIAKDAGFDFPDLVEWIVKDAGVQR
mgnify:CR=1 FL=1